MLFGGGGDAVKKSGPSFFLHSTRKALKCEQSCLVTFYARKEMHAAGVCETSRLSNDKLRHNHTPVQGMKDLSLPEGILVLAKGSRPIGRGPRRQPEGEGQIAPEVCLVLVPPKRQLGGRGADGKFGQISCAIQEGAEISWICADH